MMLQGVPGLIQNSGDGTAAAEAHESGGGEVGGFNEEERGRNEEGERNSGWNRWPRQETLALLKIRSDMDVAFRDSSLKGPLWEEVSRKLAELGYHRNAKKCKEKFENVYKYHKRTKDGRTSKPDGKAYRFFDQLEALDSHPSLPSLPQLRPQLPMHSVVMAPSPSQVTVPSQTNPTTVSQNNVTLTMNPSNPSPHQPNSSQGIDVSSYNPNMPSSPLLSNSTSSSTSSDEIPERRLKRKREWKDFFGRLMKEVIDKQEELQKKFLETFERREQDRIAREEAWRIQEMEKINRKHDLLVQERSMTAAKDASVIAFLQKITEQQNPQNPIVPPQLAQMQVQFKQQNSSPPQAPPVHNHHYQQQQPVSAPAQPPAPVLPPAPALPIASKTDNGGENFLSPSPSRWPKAEVHALIKLRTTLDTKYNENGPKGPLWEEISAAMKNLGYNRNAKRCKEKWENINKYYKKVKESNKKRPEDAKTCPYFHQLEALHKEKTKTDGSFNLGFGINVPEENAMMPIMARPEQQWPLAPEQHRQEEDQDHDNNEDYEEGDDEDKEDDGAGYEIVTNKQQPPSSMTTTVE